jgi:hypothetical protein
MSNDIHKQVGDQRKQNLDKGSRTANNKAKVIHYIDVPKPTPGTPDRVRPTSITDDGDVTEAENDSTLDPEQY